MLQILFAAKGNNFTMMSIKNGNKVPDTTCEMELTTHTAGLRPHKTRKIQENGKNVTKEEYVNSRDVVEGLRKAKKIMIADGFPAAHDKKLIEMLQAYQLKPTYVRVCRYCLLNYRFSQIRSSAIDYNKEKICPECAKEELTRALRNAKYNFGDKTLDFFFEVLGSTKNLDKTLAMISPRRLDPEITKYDTVSSSKTEDEKQISVKTLPLPQNFKKLLLGKSEFLLPVQSISVRKGLLNQKNQLIISATATGKTLIGEMAGIKNIYEKRGKMLFLVPLVALANQKYDQFKRRYGPLGIKTSIRIGAEMINTGNSETLTKTLSSDIIVGTYEGVDHIIRTGNADELGEIGTVVIDEVHMINDPERGHRLDGLIARLNYIAPAAQKIYLSATVANPEFFAKKLKSELIIYENRPVPIERHLIFVTDNEKNEVMLKLIRNEYNKTSSKGHKGQTIIFTNSRANCHSISDGLPMKSAAYHAGLHNYERKKIETQFEKGELPIVVTTAALAAGVDFPASQVIFESLAMGIEWISVQDFLQMSGRAGRPDYHDKGNVVLLPVPGKSYGTVQKGTEEEIAISLLKGGLIEGEIIYETEQKLEQTLASASTTSSTSDIKIIEESMFGETDIQISILRLLKHGFLNVEKGKISLTPIGKVANTNFLSVKNTLLIKDSISANISPLNIITNLEFFDSAQFKIAESLSKDLKINIPSRVFQGACLDIIFDGESLNRVNKKDRELLINFANDMMTCSCKEIPFCGCVERKFSEKILLLRTKGLDPAKIVKELEKNYGVTAYSGDIFSYLENAVRNLNAVIQIAEILKKTQIKKEAEILKKEIIR